MLAPRGSLEMRIAQHSDGTFGGHTSSRRPVVLVYHQQFDRVADGGVRADYDAIETKINGAAG